jgi:hypothetical protein
MKAKITDVKKIVRSQRGSGKGSPGGKAPKNIEGWKDEEEDSTDNGSDGDEDEDEDSENDTNDSQGGKGSGSGDLRNSEFKEIDPTDPGSTYTVTPWQKPAGKSIIGEVLPAGSLGDGDADVGVNCVVSRNDELDLDYLVVYYKGIDITDVLNAGLRNDIVRHFEVYFEDIKRACY